MPHFTAPIAEAIWDMKYRLKEADGTPIDSDVEDTWRRIAKALASVEKQPAKWEDKFYQALEDFKYLPADGPVASRHPSISYRYCQYTSTGLRCPRDVTSKLSYLSIPNNHLNVKLPGEAENYFLAN